jgi:hypothetical protein
VRPRTRAPRARAQGGYAPPVQHTAALPDAHTRHVLSRFTGAVTAQRLADVAAIGGIDAWFERQLTPSKIVDNAADHLWSWFPDLALTPRERWQHVQNGSSTVFSMTSDLASWIMMRRIVSNRAVAEMMVDFWSNLLHVASPDADAWVWRLEHEKAIRTNAMGSFATLLQAVIHCPAMGLYLMNDQSTAKCLNENLGRELLECHTVGVDAGYTQHDVVDSARLLTGFHVDRGNTWAASYIPKNHWVGGVKVLGFSSANNKLDGREALAAYVSYLAHHPLTARRICRRLAVRFVSDNPSRNLVTALTKVYLASGTAIVPVLRALVASAEFKASAFQKVRTPVEDTVASWLVNGSVFQQPHDNLDAANQMIFVSKQMGQVVYGWPTPDAFPDVATAWTTSGRMIASMRMHWRAASGSFPFDGAGIAYRKPIDWMPPLPATFATVVDHVVRTTLFVECTPTMLQAACLATECTQAEVITDTHRLVRLRVPWLVVSILDTAEHMSR